MNDLSDLSQYDLGSAIDTIPFQVFYDSSNNSVNPDAFRLEPATWGTDLKGTNLAPTKGTASNQRIGDQIVVTKHKYNFCLLNATDNTAVDPPILADSSFCCRLVVLRVYDYNTVGTNIPRDWKTYFNSATITSNYRRRNDDNQTPKYDVLVDKQFTITQGTVHEDRDLQVNLGKRKITWYANDNAVDSLPRSHIHLMYLVCDAVRTTNGTQFAVLPPTFYGTVNFRYIDP